MTKPKVSRWLSFWKTFGVVGIGHILCDNVWWIVGWERMLPWYIMPIVVTLVSLVIALIIEKKIHAD